MQIAYKTKKLEKICTDFSEAVIEYGILIAQKIHMRIDQISASRTIDDLIKYNIGRCHLLTGDRKGQYAMDLVHPFRLIFIVNKSGCIQIAKIWEIVDYH